MSRAKARLGGSLLPSPTHRRAPAGAGPFVEPCSERRILPPLGATFRGHAGPVDGLATVASDLSPASVSRCRSRCEGPARGPSHRQCKWCRRLAHKEDAQGLSRRERDGQGVGRAVLVGGHHDGPISVAAVSRRTIGRGTIGRGICQGMPNGHDHHAYRERRDECLSHVPSFLGAFKGSVCWGLHAA